MPDIQRWFGHFSPMLRFLALKEPKGSCRQILYFIGLFQNLQDLKLNYPLLTDENESTADVALTPLSVPPLRGCLTLTCFTRKKLVEDMIALFEGLRFLSHGPLQGELRAAPFRCMCGHPGDVEVVSDRTIR